LTTAPLDATYNFLDATADPTAFTAHQIVAIRTLLSEDSLVGIDVGTCTDASSCFAYVGATCP
jgi:hypothetical protein